MNKYIKVTNKDIYVPQKLLEHIIKETDVMPITIEEEQSEIFFGSLSGLGKVIFKNESVYEGNVKYGILDSGEEKRNCTLTFPNKTRYDGQIKLNQISGLGTYTFSSGSTYTGELKNGLRNGYGVYTTNDGIKYDGQWLNGLKHGIGKFIIKDNMIYEGEWHEGIKQGNGRIKWSSGNVYDGEFKANKIHGNGYMIWYDTSEKYTGQWVDNYQNGLGIQIWYESKGEQKYLRNRYVGEWKNGFRHGYGIFFYSNGSKFEGMWDQNYKHGFGVFTFQDGSQYIGRFHNDKMIEYNIYGFSIPNGYKNQNDRLPSANSKQGNKLKNTGAISMIAAQTNKINDDLVDSQKFSDKDENKLKSLVNNLGKIIIDQTVGVKDGENSLNHQGNKGANKENPNFNPNNSQNKLNLSGINNNQINNNNINSGLEAISEQAELFNLSVMINENNKYNKDNLFNYIYNNPNNLINPNNTGITNNDIYQPILNTTNHQKNLNNANKSNTNLVDVIKEKKESEYNVFKTLIDISDLIECDPEIELNLRDIENTLLRHLSEMKMWYRYYTNRENQKEDNASVNGSIIDDKISSKDFFTEKKGNLINHNQKENVNQINQNKNNSPQNNSNTHHLEGIYSNDLAFGMELKDLWKFLRESNILSLDFTLAQFNRLFFKGPKNYIEMFMYPEEINNKTKIYEYIYFMISKAKDDFFTKYRQKLFTSNITNNLFGYSNTTNSSVNNTERNQFQELNQYLNFKGNKEIEYFNDNIHNKRQTILLRHFYEAILRSAYLRYSHLPMTLNSKINNLIDTCIRTNMNFKKVSRKSQMHTESSINSSVVVDMKVKSFENNLEFFLGNFENRLKQSFKKLYLKSTVNLKNDDMTITYRFFYDNLVKKSELLLSLFDKPKFIELINIYHKDKIIIQENQKITRELHSYIENLLDLEFMFYEYCELIFFISRKILSKNNMNESKDNYANLINNIESIIDSIDSYKLNDKYYYTFPKLKHHVVFENIMANQKAREEEERRKKMELKRIDFERKMMKVEDTNVLPDFIEEEENDSDSSIYSNY